MGDFFFKSLLTLTTLALLSAALLVIGETLIPFYHPQAENVRWWIEACGSAGIGSFFILLGVVLVDYIWWGDE